MKIGGISTKTACRCNKSTTRIKIPSNKWKDS